MNLAYRTACRSHYVIFMLYRCLDGRVHDIILLGWDRKAHWYDFNSGILGIATLRSSTFSSMVVMNLIFLISCTLSASNDDVNSVDGVTFGISIGVIQLRP